MDCAEQSGMVHSMQAVIQDPAVKGAKNKSMMNPDTCIVELFQSPVRRELDSLEQRLELVLHSDIPVIEEICRYINDSPGKRVRPSILFLATKSIGPADGDMVTAGVAVELIHSATLIHDDIIDDHETRRGKPTIYSRWGNGTAAIMGDFLYSKAFALLGESGLLEITELLSSVTHIMSIGEMMQLQLSRDLNVSEAGYMEMIYKKTASLFSAACECGAILGRNENGHRRSFSIFGEKIGLAFQITDDLFDYLAADDVIGKPTASDFTEGRITLPFITAFRNAPEVVRRRVGDLFRFGLDSGEHWDEVISFVRNYGGVEYSIRKAKDLGEQAKVYLNELDPTPERDALCFAADYVVGRIDPFYG